MTKRNHHYSKQDDMYLRVKKIDRFKADYLISIHQNASGNKSAWVFTSVLLLSKY